MISNVLFLYDGNLLICIKQADFVEICVAQIGPPKNIG